MMALRFGISARAQVVCNPLVYKLSHSMQSSTASTTH